MSTERQRQIWPVAAFLVMTAIFLVGALIPGKLRAAIESWLSLPFAVPPIAHLVFFAGMTFCLRLVLPASRAWQILLLMLGFGGGLELVQGSLPGRIPSLEDFGLDTLGALAGLMLFSCVDRKP